MHIEIRIERPIVLALVAGGMIYGLSSVMRTDVSAANLGGDDRTTHEQVADAETQIRDLREQQSVLQHREAILREQLAALQAEVRQNGYMSPETLQEMSVTTAQLVALLKDQRSAESKILSSLRDMWEAEGIARKASSNSNGQAPSVLQWPVEPALGISAHFHDKGYKARFGMEHNAVDIPVNQGTTVHAAADGIVKTVSDKGLGYSSLVIEHAGGVATLYGHVSKFLVTEGQIVHAGDPVALSGGRPGSAGAGMFTTGPHLHFEVHVSGHAADPLGYLPEND